MERLNILLMGAIATMELVTSLFFFRFWRTGRDSFFLFLALSFLVDGVNRTIMSLAERPSEASAAHYMVRFISFLLIIAAVLMKNRRPRTGVR